jgi:hypothetical protein
MRKASKQHIGQRKPVLPSFAKARIKLRIKRALRLFVSISGSDMKHFDISDFYQIGKSLGAIEGFNGGKKLSAFELSNIRDAAELVGLLCSSTEAVIGLQTSSASAERLKAKLHEILEKAEATKRISGDDWGWLGGAVAEFETIFFEETKLLATYLVAPKRNYSIRLLLNQAENEFPESVRRRLSPQTIRDIKDAGRCIAFESGTAAGFHSFRALEATALDYLSRRKLAPPKRDLFTYFDMLEKDGADAKVIQIGQQIRSLRRNPLAHPSENLDADEGIEAFQLCTTAITALIRDMEKRQLF